MQVCYADKLSNCRAQLYDFKQIGNALFDRFNKQSTPELQAWYDAEQKAELHSVPKLVEELTKKILSK